jgi:membrane protein
MISIFITAAKRWWNANPSTNGAALAYYAIFSLAPIGIIFIVAFGQFFGREAVEGKLVGAFQNFMGPQSSELIQSLLAYTYAPTPGFIAAIISILFIIVGALALFSQAQRAVADIWFDPLHHGEPQSFLRTKILAIIMILVLGVFLIVSLSVQTFMTAFSSGLSTHLLSLGSLISLYNVLASSLYIFILFSLMYAFLPGVPVRWGAAIIGGFVGTLLFIIGRSVLGIYFTLYILSSVYGIAGAIILVLVWFYYTALIFFFGAAVAFAVDQKLKMRQTLHT